MLGVSGQELARRASACLLASRAAPARHRIFGKNDEGVRGLPKARRRRMHLHPSPWRCGALYNSDLHGIARGRNEAPLWQISTSDPTSAFHL